MGAPLQGSSGNILDDGELIAALEESKAAAMAVQARMEAAEAHSSAIAAARAAYACVPERAVAIFLAVQALSAIDAIYQLSLECFRLQFLHCLRTAAPSDVLSVRAVHSVATAHAGCFIEHLAC
jgi:dynein heavy chain, axonemal